jgi:hypothetical protein
MPCLCRVLLISVAICCYSTAASAGEYHLGQGYTTGNVNVAGYVNLVADDPANGKAELIVDDLSLFVSGRFNKYLNPFFEAEITSASILRESGSLFSDSKPEIVLERLYNDSYLTEQLTLRIGKMLTPVGEWNTIHAAPLVWTTSRPLTTYRSYPEYTSGMSLTYTDQYPKLPEVQLYWQPGGEIIPKPRSIVVREYTNAAGLHLNWPIGLNDKVGISLQHADVNGTSEKQTLAGFNARKTFGKFQFETEATYTHLNGNNPARMHDHEWGAYVLGVYALTDNLHVMAQQEHFVDRETAQSSRNTLIGLSYRPDPAIVWKIEYINNNGAKLEINTGFYASFSVLF